MGRSVLGKRARARLPSRDWRRIPARQGNSLRSSHSALSPLPPRTAFALRERLTTTEAGRGRSQEEGSPRHPPWSAHARGSHRGCPLSSCFPVQARRCQSGMAWRDVVVPSPLVLVWSRRQPEVAPFFLGCGYQHVLFKPKTVACFSGTLTLKMKLCPSLVSVGKVWSCPGKRRSLHVQEAELTPCRGAGSATDIALWGSSCYCRKATEGFLRCAD